MRAIEEDEPPLIRTLTVLEQGRFIEWGPLLLKTHSKRSAYSKGALIGWRAQNRISTVSDYATIVNPFTAHFSFYQNMCESRIKSNIDRVFCSCYRRLIAAMFFPQNVDTVQFSNEAFNDSSMMSFDNVLYGNLDDPVLMTPLEFPIDDKHPLPQVHLKPWPNGVASRCKLKTWVSLRPRLVRACVHLRLLAMTCAHFGRNQICTQVKPSFSPYGHPTQVNAS